MRLVLHLVIFFSRLGSNRFGKILEDLDALAGSIAYEHCEDDNASTRPMTIVTASVDHIILQRPLRADRDMRLRGHVTWVGRSSMEVIILVEAQLPPDANGAAGAWEQLAYADFCMVARDPATDRYEAA